MFKKKTNLIIILLFFISILTPPIMMCLHKLHVIYTSFTGSLSGYFEKKEKQSFTLNNYKNKSFQKSFEDYFSEKLTFREFYIRLYNQIQYSMFNISNRPIGKHNQIFEMGYINSECVLLPEYDYSIPSNYENLTYYVKNIETLQNLLKENDINFLFYITPSKANVCYDDLPLKYRIKKQQKNSPYCYLKELLNKSNINYLDSRDFLLNNEIPNFYPTGIHWSRPLEQTVSKAIINKLIKISGKAYPRKKLENLMKSDKPFVRDTDVFLLANIFEKQKNIYYEYEATFDVSENSIKPKFLIQGGSFAIGFYNYDYGKYTDECYKIFYNQTFQSQIGVSPIQKWEDIPIDSILKNIDFVIIELNESVINQYSDGFVDYLISQLINYKNGENKK